MSDNRIEELEKRIQILEKKEKKRSTNRKRIILIAVALIIVVLGTALAGYMINTQNKNIIPFVVVKIGWKAKGRTGAGWVNSSITLYAISNLSFSKIRCSGGSGHYGENHIEGESYGFGNYPIPMATDILWGMWVSSSKVATWIIVASILDTRQTENRTLYIIITKPNELNQMDLNKLKEEDILKEGNTTASFLQITYTIENRDLPTIMAYF